MTWTKLSDDFADDCETLTDAAFRLHVEGLLWSNRKLLDCRIPKAHLRRFASHPTAVTELVAVGWWTDDGDAYTIRHHAIYQRTREAVVNQQAANQKNGRKGGRPKGPAREITDLKKTHSVTDSLTESPSETETKRDRTGQDKDGPATGELQDSTGVDPWATPPGANQTDPPPSTDTPPPLLPPPPPRSPAPPPPPPPAAGPGVSPMTSAQVSNFAHPDPVATKTTVAATKKAPKKQAPPPRFTCADCGVAIQSGHVRCNRCMRGAA